MLLLTRYTSVNERSLVEHLRRRGVTKYIGFEVPVSRVHELYGVPFEVVAADIDHGSDLRVLDYNGSHIFSSFDFNDLGSPTMVEQ
jgi:hypothetical protein